MWCQDLFKIIIITFEVELTLMSNYHMKQRGVSLSVNCSGKKEAGVGVGSVIEIFIQSLNQLFIMCQYYFIVIVIMTFLYVTESGKLYPTVYYYKLNICDIIMI